MSINSNAKSFGTAPVFFTAISTILGAILFLRFGYAVGMLSFLGTIGVILIGHLVTIPTALSISELATNQRVEGGGEYFIISRSFGLNIGATIGIALYLSQAISVAFYIIAFTEAFSPLLDKLSLTPEWARRIVSVPSMIFLAFLILNQYGIHARPAALFVKIASRYDADIQVEKGGNTVSGKSIMGLMTLEASRGTKLKVSATGPDAEELLDELQELIESKFDED